MQDILYLLKYQGSRKYINDIGTQSTVRNQLLAKTELF